MSSEEQRPELWFSVFKQGDKWFVRDASDPRSSDPRYAMIYMSTREKLPELIGGLAVCGEARRAYLQRVTTWFKERVLYPCFGMPEYQDNMMGEFNTNWDDQVMWTMNEEDTKGVKKASFDEENKENIPPK
ncbi:Nn.00g024430.m01.CDS01 [Neocucurbitaria sp. VM-36]